MNFKGSSKNIHFWVKGKQESCLIVDLLYSNIKQIKIPLIYLFTGKYQYRISNKEG